jgi:biopolymer transport protein ExbB
MHDLMGGIEFISRGGFMMIPLLLAALIGLAVLIERLYVLYKRFPVETATISNIFSLIKNNKMREARDACAQHDAPVSAVLAAGIEHFDNSIEEMELAMKNRAEEWVPRLEKRVEVIDTVITAAPLMGLLGTIVGMMASFRVLSEKGVNEPNAITGGVAEALVATATGIVIALVCLIGYNHITTKVKMFIYEIESMASRLVELRLSAQRQKKNGGNS